MPLATIAEVAFKQIVRAQGHELRLFLALAPLEYLEDGTLKIIVGQGMRNAFNVAEEIDVPLPERFLPLVGKGHHKETARSHQLGTEQMGHGFPSVQFKDRLTPIDLGHRSRFVPQRDEALAYPLPLAPDVAPDRTLSPRKIIFLLQTPIDPSCRMALLAGSSLVLLQPGVDDRRYWVQDPTATGVLLLIDGDVAVRDGFAHGLARVSELSRNRANGIFAAGSRPV